MKEKENKRKDKSKSENEEAINKTNTLKVFKIGFGIMLSMILILAFIYLLKKSNISIGKKEIVNPEITFNTSMGSFTAELYPDKAPETVRNIIALSKSGYYNGKIIYGKDVLAMHLGRLKNGLQEDPTISTIDQNIEKGSKEDIKYSIKGEFSANGFNKNDIPNERYTLAIARPDYTKIMANLKEQSYNAGNSNILIVLRAGEKLNGNYAAFGKITKGQEVIDEIEKLELKDIERMDNMVKSEKDPAKKKQMEKAFAEKLLSLNGFVNPPVIESVDVDTKGIEYSLPKYIKAFSLEEYVAERYKVDPKETKIKR